MIEVEDLRKEYGGFVAVEGSTFTVEPGEVFGVVGPNGAGKTTTLKMLAGLVEPTAGTARVAGRPAGDPEMRRSLGFLPEESPLYEDMTAESYLHFFADLYDVPREVATRRIDEALTSLDLEHRDRKLGDVSKGMKRKVAIARSLVNDPDVLVYDEPASGLDPLTTNYIVEFTRELSDEGKTVVFSAHNLYHVESICDRVVIMNRGEIIARGTVEEIRAEYGSTEYQVYTTVDVEGSVPVDGATAADPDAEYVRTVGEMAAVESVREDARAAGGEVVDILTRRSSLEDVFLDVAGGEEVTRRRRDRDRTTGAGAGSDGDTGRRTTDGAEPGDGGTGRATADGDGKRTADVAAGAGDGVGGGTDAGGGPGPDGGPGTDAGDSTDADVGTGTDAEGDGR